MKLKLGSLLILFGCSLALANPWGALLAVVILGATGSFVVIAAGTAFRRLLNGPGPR